MFLNTHLTHVFTLDKQWGASSYYSSTVYQCMSATYS